MSIAPSTVAVKPVALYQPTDAEIADVLAESVRTWPTLKQRIEKAEQILRSGGLVLDPLPWAKSNVVYWKVMSQAHIGKHYIVTSRHLSCCCPDKGQRLGDMVFCKHSIAVAAYLRILRDHFNADVAAGHIILTITHTGFYIAYAQGLGIVTLERRDTGYHFVDHASAVKYSIWLAKREMATFSALFQVGNELVAA